MSPHEPRSPETAAGSLLARVLPLCAILFAILGCKLWLIAEHGSPLPFLDQWEGEGAQLLVPCLAGTWRIADVLVPFNEHRIVPTRLLVLALFEANGRQWDAQVQMVAGAIVHATAGCLLAVLLGSGLTGPRRFAWMAFLLPLFCLPFDWQNTLWGFQSQFYFLILFSAACLWGMLSHPAGSRAWWCGVVAGICACFTMGSGGFAGLALVGWLGVKMVTNGAARRDRGNTFALSVAVALATLGFALYTPPQTAALAKLHPATVVDLATSFLWRLGWPHTLSPLLALVAFAPLATLLWLHLRGKTERTRAEEFVFALGLWVALQCAALAWARHDASLVFTSRYTDLLAIGVLVNFSCALRLSVVCGPHRRAATAACTTIWAVLTLAALAPHLQRNLRSDLPGLFAIQKAQILGVRQFLATDRIDDLGGTRVQGLPQPGLERMAALLRDPHLRTALPAGLRLHGSDGEFIGPLSRAVRGLVSGWMLVLFSSGLCVLGAVFGALRSIRKNPAASRAPHDHAGAGDPPGTPCDAALPSA